jgi:hypothetical protein
MLTDEERRRGAQLLFDAERQRRAIPQLSKTFPGIEIVDAYRIQDLWAELKMAPGVGVAGHKIGLSSRAMQMASKMTEPAACADKPRRQTSSPQMGCGRIEGLARLLRALNIRDQPGLRADIEEAFDQHRIVAGRPHDRRDRIRRHSLQLRQHGQRVAGGVLGVEQHPIEARAGQRLRNIGAGKATPESDLLSPFDQCAFERVDGEFDSNLRQMKRRLRRADRSPHESHRPGRYRPGG